MGRYKNGFGPSTFVEKVKDTFSSADDTVSVNKMKHGDMGKTMSY
jgi:hypothetical protein